MARFDGGIMDSDDADNNSDGGYDGTAPGTAPATAKSPLIDDVIARIKAGQTAG